MKVEYVHNGRQKEILIERHIYFYVTNVVELFFFEVEIP